LSKNANEIVFACRLTRAATAPAAQSHLQNNSITRWAKKGLIKKRAPEFPGAIYPSLARSHGGGANQLSDASAVKIETCVHCVMRRRAAHIYFFLRRAWQTLNGHAKYWIE
jgi:hypothetical protein